MKICYMSDLHMEIGSGGPDVFKKKGFKLEPADVLILAGDIAPTTFFKSWRTDINAVRMQVYLRKFMTDIGSHFKHVLWVPGNHEYYGDTLADGPARIKGWLAKEGFNNVTWLDEQSIIIDEITFFGATLWTDCCNYNPIDMMRVQQFMNDYGQIEFVAGTQLNIAHTVQIQRRTRQVIENLLATNPAKLVMITHTAPHEQSQLAHRSPLTMPAFCCTNMAELIRAPVKVWIHGHTHDDVDYQINGVRIVTNQHGYQGYEPQAKQFIPKYIEI